MHPGEVLDGRFQIVDVAGMGGMGAVYRAVDRHTHDLVALKVLRATTGDHAERFAREIRVLAGLRHPGIVRYVADGQTRAGDQWLAMEWLEGESLSKRLASSSLTPLESIELARRVAEALGAAHERGVIHRDVKPSNLLLVNGELERVKVLDFGVARIVDARSTKTGVMVGTPGYMAPEQVKSDREITPRADVFAVGCLLFECLTGRPAYQGEHVLAILAKIFLEEPPRLSECRPDLPAELEDLLARVMAKEPERRPRDGTALAELLATLGHVHVVARPPTVPPVGPVLTTTERRLMCVVLIGHAVPQDLTIVDPPMGVPQRFVETSASGDMPLAEIELDHVARTYGATLDKLADGSYVATVAGGGAASDLVMQAARCALALKLIAGASPIALATGRGVMAGRWPVGDAIDRAATLLDAGPQRVRLDEVTAGLLDSRFDIGGDEAGLYLAGERDLVEVRRTLLGKQVPCVGRDRELGILAGLFDECVAEPVARAVVVTGVEGIGKSRVRYELLRRVQDHPPGGERVAIWFGHGDPLRAGSPFGILAPALRRVAGIHEGEPVEVRRQKLRARVMRNAHDHVELTTQFLGELIGTPFPDASSPELDAARADPMLMGEQVRHAFEHFLAVETAAQPVLIVLEDLHWGDLPTVKLFDSALRNLPDRPWMVLAIARPEVHDQFPRLWADRGVQELRLEELTKKGSEKLVRRALGETASPELVARLVEQAGGNAFYLEELIRAVVDGKTDPNEKAPETVLALVQGRLERLEVDARRVLRAASVFGRRFWRGGALTLVGVSRETGTRAWLDELVDRELVARTPSSRFPSEAEYQFRHALVQQAAYGMLTDSDRKLGHALAGEWLELAGEVDAMVLAEHYERGGDPRAVEHYLRAAEQALVACDFTAAAARATRGIANRAKGEILGALELVLAEAYKWSGEFALAAAPALRAMSLLPAGSARWHAAAWEAADAHGKLGDAATLVAIGTQLRDAPDLPESLAASVIATAQTAFQLYSHGLYDLAAALLDRVDRVPVEAVGPNVAARIYQARSSRSMFTGNIGAYLESELAAAAAFERAGDQRNTCMQRGHVGYACNEIGAYADAERHLREALESGERLGLSNVVATAKHNLGKTLQMQGRLAEALAIEDQAVEELRLQGDRRLHNASRTYLANILADLGELGRAERELRDALATAHPPMRPEILGYLARVLLAKGDVAGALDAANEAADVLDHVEEGESLVRMMVVEAQLAMGEHEGARVAARIAYARVVERAERITDPQWRRMFLEHIPENRRIVELARQLGITS